MILVNNKTNITILYGLSYTFIVSLIELIELELEMVLFLVGVKKRVRIITLKTHTKNRKMRDEGRYLIILSKLTCKHGKHSVNVHSFH